MLKRFLFILLACTVGFCIAGCNKKDDTPETPIEEGSDVIAIEKTLEGLSYDVGTVIGVSEICETDSSKQVAETCFLDSTGGVSNTLTISGEGTQKIQVYVKYTDGSEWMGEFTYNVNEEKPVETITPIATPTPEVPAFEVSDKLDAALNSNVAWTEYQLTYEKDGEAVPYGLTFTSSLNFENIGLSGIAYTSSSKAYSYSGDGTVWTMGILTKEQEEKNRAEGSSIFDAGSVFKWFAAMMSGAADESFTSFREEYPEDTESVKIYSHTFKNGVIYERLVETDENGSKTISSHFIPTEEMMPVMKEFMTLTADVYSNIQTKVRDTELKLYDAIGKEYTVKEIYLMEDLMEVAGFTNVSPTYYFVELDNGDYLLFNIMEYPEEYWNESSKGIPRESDVIEALDAYIRAYVTTLAVNGSSDGGNELPIDLVELDAAMTNLNTIVNKDAFADEVKAWVDFWEITDVEDNFLHEVEPECTLGELFLEGKYGIEYFPEAGETLEQYIKKAGIYNEEIDRASLVFDNLHLNSARFLHVQELFENSFIGTEAEMRVALNPPEPTTAPTPEPTPEVTPEVTPEISPTPTVKVTPTPTPYVPPTYAELHPELYRWPERELVYRRFIFSLTNLSNINGTIHSQGTDPGMDYYVDRWVPTPTPVIDDAGKEWYPFYDENDEIHNPWKQDDGTVTYPTFGGVPTPTPTPSPRPTVNPEQSWPTYKPQSTSTPTPTPFIYINKDEENGEDDDSDGSRPIITLPPTSTPKPTSKPTPKPTQKPGSTPKPTNTPTPTPFIFVNKNEDKEYWTSPTPIPAGTGSATNEPISLKIGTMNAVYTVSNLTNTACMIDQSNSTSEKVEVVYNGNRFYITIEEKSKIDNWTSKSFMSTVGFKDGSYTISVSGSVMVAGKNGTLYCISYKDLNDSPRKQGYLIIARNSNEYITVRSLSPVPTDDLTIVAKLVSIAR